MKESLLVVWIQFNRFFQSMRAQGIYLAPSQYEAGFVSTAHTDADIDQTIAAVEVALEASMNGDAA